MQMKINNDTYEVITSQDITNIEKAVDKSALTMPLVAVYCGSRLGNNEVYEQAARELGRELADNGMGLVYGGASIGLMGAVADEVIQGGAQAVGVIPTFMLKHEIAHEQLTRLHLTDTMHTRKTVMAEYADAFIPLPGGLGTLAEMLEIATWSQLSQHEKPKIILNINGFYDRMIEHLKYTADQGFMKQEDLERLVVCNSISEAIDMLKTVVTIEGAVDTEKMAGN